MHSVDSELPINKTTAQGLYGAQLVGAQIERGNVRGRIVRIGVGNASGNWPGECPDGKERGEIYAELQVCSLLSSGYDLYHPG